MKTIKVAVFTHKDGSRFLIPGLWEDPDGNTSCKLTIDVMMTSVMIGATYEWISIEINDDGTTDNLPHYKSQLIGRQFAHGGIDILMLQS